MNEQERRRSTRDEWRSHPNIHGPASTLLAIHDQFRVAAERLILLFEREPDVDLGWVGRAFEPLATTLHHHHHAEEMMLFPMIGRRTGDKPQRLIDDHKELTDAIDALTAALVRGASDREGAQSKARAFADVLIAHLDREEAHVIPVLLEMTAGEAWALIHAPALDE